MSWGERNMGLKVTVIGAGPGGYVAAIRAAQQGAASDRSLCITANPVYRLSTSNYSNSGRCYWWHNNGMNDLCDRGASIRTITQRVNGGFNGLADRQNQFRRIKELFP